MPCFVIFIIEVKSYNVNLSSQMALTTMVQAVKLSISKNLLTLSSYPGPRLNIKTVLSTYGDFQVKDKTAVRTSYL